MDEYNYGVFDMAAEEPSFSAFRDGLHAGERPPDFPLEDLDTGETVTMKSLWKQGPAVIEFGSFT
jgi:hypothetical protein